MLTFEWNRDKAQENLAKHEVSFAEAATAFADQPLAKLVTRQQSQSQRGIVAQHAQG